MRILTINASWRETKYGYITGEIIVKDDEDNVLMWDEDMYYSFRKFVDYINRKFKQNKRFNWLKATYFKSEQRFEILTEDLK